MSGAPDELIAHLGMIQGVINRVGASSATMKGLAGTIAAGAIALYGTVPTSQWVFLGAAAVPILIFWVMDGRYLRIERAYRELYDEVRTGGGSVEPFSMNYRVFLRKVPNLFSLMISWSIGAFYAVILIAFVLIYFGSLKACPTPLMRLT